MRRISCEACPARSANVVCNLPSDVLAEFRAAGAPVLYRPRQVVFGEGTPSTALYLVCHGAVKLYHSDRFGRDHILEVAGPGALLGELSLDDRDVMSVSAEALGEAQVVHLPRERLASFVQRHPATAVRFLAALSRELGLARRKVRELALKGAESRLASLLVQLGRSEGALVTGRRLHLRYGRRELGEMIGATTETVIRMLAVLKRKGVIATEKRDVVITDLNALLRIAQHDELAADEVERCSMDRSGAGT